MYFGKAGTVSPSSACHVLVTGRWEDGEIVHSTPSPFGTIIFSLWLTFAAHHIHSHCLSSAKVVRRERVIYSSFCSFLRWKKPKKNQRTPYAFNTGWYWKYSSHSRDSLGIIVPKLSAIIINVNWDGNVTRHDSCNVWLKVGFTIYVQINSSALRSTIRWK